MDLLTQELQQKRQALSHEFGGRKFVNRAEIEKKRLQKLRGEERREFASNHAATAKFPTPSTQSAFLSPTSPTVEELSLPKEEVIRRLLFLKQPITLFGEDDAARLERLKLVMKEGAFEIDSDTTDGQKNEFLGDITNLKKRKSHKRARIDMAEEGDRADSKKEKMGDDEGITLEELCDEDRILVFFQRLLSEWKEEFNGIVCFQQMTAEEKMKMAISRQCERDLKPLFKLCKKKVLPSNIRNALVVMVECFIKRDYVAAMDQYNVLSIGKAPWPMGVTRVGIHDRAAREKIQTSCVAHIMNNETTRKYLHSIKRLLTFCQRRYPTTPSKSVEFNSLANGSDLQALLAEQGL